MTTVKKTILTFLTTIITNLSFGQTLRTIKPTIGTPNNYTKQEQIIWQSVLDKYSKINSADLDCEALNTKDKALIERLEMGSGPLTEGPGCSWYCGGQMYKVT